MQLSSGQREAVSKLNRFMNSDDKIIRICGYAGTGKSTVISHVLGDQDVTYATPTAKAAQVLIRKGVAAQTIHSLLYVPYEYQHPITKKPTLGFKVNDKSPLRDGGTLVIDESSMVGSRMVEDLLELPVKIIAVGDPGQLPPVMSKGNVSLLSGDRPDVMLTEVHRTALDSPVLAMATYVRKFGKLPAKNGFKEGSGIVNDTREAGDLTSYDQVIVGRHKTRFQANTHIRKLKGYEGLFPNVGETVLCKQNDLSLGLINGEQYQVSRTRDADEETMMVAMTAYDGSNLYCTAWKHGFQGPEGKETLEHMPLKDRASNTELWHSEAITAHSSQGSEWNRVLVVDESKVFNNAAGSWLYTALTRAQKEVVVTRR
jgi:exodeoxyribonuclease-5